MSGVGCAVYECLIPDLEVDFQAIFIRANITEGNLPEIPAVYTLSVQNSKKRNEGYLVVIKLIIRFSRNFSDMIHLVINYHLTTVCTEKIQII